MAYRCGRILERPEFSFNRSVFKAMGYSDKNLERPMIGIANSWSELVPGNYNLRTLAEAVKRGIHMAGGTAVEFGVIGACDGTAQGNVGMNYILPSRDLIANDVEVMVQAHQLDGVVLMGSCDKIVPGMLMAAARLGLPAILLPGGPMLGGTEFDGRPSDLTSVSEAVGMLKAGKIDEKDLDALEEDSAPTCGSCSFFGTANTMCCLAEALGMSLPTAALIPAVFAERTRIAEATGEAIVGLVKTGLGADRIITRASLGNAAKVLMATCGSTNAVMHLTAIADEIGIASAEMMAIIDEASEVTPQVVKVNPSSRYNMEDFYRSGGVPQAMREIAGLLDLDCPTVTGASVSENLAAAGDGAGHRVDREVIRTALTAFNPSRSIAILHGNLAPDGCVTKPGAIHPDMRTFTGSARVFDGEEEAERAILAGKIAKGDVVVIRYEGPKGGPGMREMYKAMKYLYGMGLGRDTAVITDGRFSGTNNGCFVGHISPEAADGGPIALVREGDRVTIDIPGKAITLHVESSELERRKSEWHRPDPRFRTGYLALYSRFARSASEGATLKAW